MKNTNARIIAEALQEKGFDAYTFASCGVAVSLTNRRPSVMEVEQAIDEFNEMGDYFTYAQTSDGVIVTVA
jgi:2-methylisocitrate lyase-like PEP mutase family enzyme